MKIFKFKNSLSINSLKIKFEFLKLILSFTHKYETKIIFNVTASFACI